jgi:regulator of protease activity HflC (stomatin/prohibitin superfamily)
LNADIRQSLDRIMARIYPVKIGKQVVDYSIKDIKIDDDNRARIILDVDIDVPEPLLDGHFKFNII